MMLRSSLTTLAILFAGLGSFARADVFELRTYTTNDGKLADLESRFRDHTVQLFEKHGIENVGYWIPTDGEKAKNTLIYVVKHKSPEGAKQAWKDFVQDEDWKTAYKASIANGALVKKVDSVYMNATDYCPEIEKSASAEASDAVYELRIYNTNEGKLDGLNARFRDHTTKLFERHGIENVAYWTPSDKPTSENQLIYIIKHNSRDAAKKSWKAFGSDPEWKKVAKESQKDGKFLAERPTSIYMKATDYSPLR
ncbi:MAG: NIPSNAP family protein [Aureliella sp.]